MAWISAKFEPTRRPDGGYAFHLTPSEWRAVIEDEGFLRRPDNDWLPRRLMGLPVEIVPDRTPPHRAPECAIEGP